MGCCPENFAIELRGGRSAVLVELGGGLIRWAQIEAGGHKKCLGVVLCGSMSPPGKRLEGITSGDRGDTARSKWEGGGEAHFRLVRRLCEREGEAHVGPKT